MHIGHYISGAAHAGLIGWALAAGAFRSEPSDFEVTAVAMITTEAFEALLKAQEAPDAVTDVAMPAAPATDTALPSIASEADPDLARPQPVETEATAPDAMPDLTNLAAPQPSDVTAALSELVPPAPEPEVFEAPVPTPLTPPSAPEPAPRVAPQPVAQPDPETRIDDTLREATKPADAPAPLEPVEETTAPEAATEEIVSEPKIDKSLAPSTSVRPRARPTRTVETAQPDPPEPDATPVAPDNPTKPDESVNAAIAAALEESGAETTATQTPARTGPPLTSGEKEGLRLAVQQCWVVDVGGRAADVTVTVGLSLDRNGKVQGNIRLLSATGGDDNAAKIAFQAARRAVLRCQKSGYKLPIDKFDSWRDIEMTFNPEKMRSK